MSGDEKAALAIVFCFILIAAAISFSAGCWQAGLSFDAAAAFVAAVYWRGRA